MSGDDYRRALDAAVKEYEALGAERQRIDARLGELAQSIGTLTRLCGIRSSVVWGLTDACRTILRSAGLPLTVADVRERLLGVGVDLSKYANDLAAIHTTLKRLNEAEEIRFVTNGYGKVAYLWSRPGRAALLGPDVAQVVREMGEPPAAATPRRRRSAASPGKKRGK